MTIVHVLESGGGTAEFVLSLVRYLPNHHHVIIYSDRTFGDRLQQVKESNVNASFCFWENAQREISPFKDIKAAFSLYQLLKNVDDDVVHLHSSKAGFIGRLVCFLLEKKKVIYTPNGISFLREDVANVRRGIFLILEIIAHWVKGEIICCSKSEAAEFIKRGIDCTYISNGTEVFECPLEKKNNESIIIATCGRATTQKNPRLFNAIAKHFENDPVFKFVWIGGGELEHLLDSSNVTITGWLSRNEVTDALAKSDIYLSTALWEGLPFAVLEAMNLKKPLILSHCVGNVDLVSNDYNGFGFHSKNEAIREILFFKNNLDKIESFGRNSYKRVSADFNVVFMAENYEKAYASLFSNGAAEGNPLEKP
jgi:glycosyltransferase involved in cell wall biosynthesis